MAIFVNIYIWSHHSGTSLISATWEVTKVGWLQAQGQLSSVVRSCLKSIAGPGGAQRLSQHPEGGGGSEPGLQEGGKAQWWGTSLEAWGLVFSPQHQKAPKNPTKTQQ